MRLLAAVALLLGVPALVEAQAWNDPGALALVRRAVARRDTVQADSTLRAWQATARGFVFFLGQVGEGLATPPRLVKADQLAVEVYWQFPGRSKQVIRAWRDGRYLPTDISYHRDHLGIVTNNFGERIRIGDGDEVRDATHPLSAAGPSVYDYALGDSLLIGGGAGRVLVREVLVRPRTATLPLVVGQLFVDVATAELVRFRFSFTPAAYLDPAVEDISIVLENALFEGRWWLPYRQEVEIRRRSEWFDFPARGIIRGRWEIGDHALQVAPPATVAAQREEIGGLRAPGGDSTLFTGSLADAIAGVATPVNEQDMDGLRAEAARIAGTRALSGLPRSRLAGNAVSDLVHVNRVQGLTLGLGAVLGVGGTRLEFRPRLGIGTADGRVTGGLGVSLDPGRWRLGLGAHRTVADFAELPVVSGVVNTFTAQEGGNDHGDYLLRETAGLAASYRLTGRTTLGGELLVERSSSVAVEATPAAGTYRDNPALGAGTWWMARLRLERAGGGIAVRRDLRGALALEAADGPDGAAYLRAGLEGRWLHPAGPGDLLARGTAVVGTADMPAYRGLALGGRGTLVGTPYRAYGGRSAVLLHAEWQLPVPVPAIPLGAYATTGTRAVLAPFVAAGWADDAGAGLPWGPSDGVRPVAGLAAELFMRLIRVEFGVDLRGGGVGVTVDLSRDWWGLL